jgi:hypothetical protein
MVTDSAKKENKRTFNSNCATEVPCFSIGFEACSSSFPTFPLYQLIQQPPFASTASSLAISSNLLSICLLAMVVLVLVQAESVRLIPRHLWMMLVAILVQVGLGRYSPAEEED